VDAKLRSKFHDTDNSRRVGLLHEGQGPKGRHQKQVDWGIWNVLLDLAQQGGWSRSVLKQLLLSCITVIPVFWFKVNLNLNREEKMKDLLWIPESLRKKEIDFNKIRDKGKIVSAGY
jgi:hypothetical protein